MNFLNIFSNVNSIQLCILIVGIIVGFFGVLQRDIILLLGIIGIVIFTLEMECLYDYKKTNEQNSMFFKNLIFFIAISGLLATSLIYGYIIKNEMEEKIEKLSSENSNLNDSYKLCNENLSICLYQNSPISAKIHKPKNGETVSGNKIEVSGNLSGKVIDDFANIWLFVSSNENGPYYPQVPIQIGQNNWNATVYILSDEGYILIEAVDESTHEKVLKILENYHTNESKEKQLEGIYLDKARVLDKIKINH